jgi:hypothetical protein
VRQQAGNTLPAVCLGHHLRESLNRCGQPGCAFCIHLVPFYPAPRHENAYRRSLQLWQNLELGLVSTDVAVRRLLSRSDVLAVSHDSGNGHRYCFTLTCTEQPRPELTIDHFGDRAKSTAYLRAQSPARKGGAEMFRRTVSRSNGKGNLYRFFSKITSQGGLLLRQGHGRVSHASDS